MKHIDIHSNIFNPVYYPFLENDKRFLVFYGGAGSGKSYFIGQRCIFKCLKNKYFRLLFARKVYRTVRHSQFQLFKDLIQRMNLSELFTIKESLMEIECINGNKMIAVGMDDREKIKSIQEPTDVWCEEATEFSREDFMHLNLRLRTARAQHNQLYLSFNPITTENWIYDSFFIKKEFDADIIKTTYHDNQFIDTEFYKELEQLKFIDENYYNIYTAGEWGGKIKGIIFPEWQLCDDIPDGCIIIYGLDFGFNNPTALIKVGIKENACYLKQILYRSKWTNSDLINELKLLNIKEVIYADANEPQRIEEIYRAGFNIKSCDKEKGSVKKGIDTIKAMRLNITKDSADILKEIRNYKWQEDKNGNFIDMPVKFLDHSLDAVRYAIHTHLIAPTGIYRFTYPLVADFK